MFRRTLGMALAGAAAGLVTGLFGGGGGMVLVPLLTLLTDLEEEEVFPGSLSVILPVCVVSLLFAGGNWHDSLPFLPGSFLGGWIAGQWGGKIPVKWLHKLLAVLILWGGVRYLWS